MPKKLAPCLGCVAKEKELARLRDNQSDQIKAHLVGAKIDSDRALAQWVERFDRLLKILEKTLEAAAHGKIPCWLVTPLVAAGVAAIPLILSRGLV